MINYLMAEESKPMELEVISRETAENSMTCQVTQEVCKKYVNEVKDLFRNNALMEQVSFSSKFP